MSENLDLVRSIYADWERGDFSVTRWAVSDLEFVTVDGPSPTILRGVGATGKKSGVEVDQTGSKGACLFHFLDGKVTKLVLYSARATALADLGLKD